MDPKTHSPPSPPPGYQQSMQQQNANNHQLGPNLQQHHPYQPPYQQQTYPMQPQMTRPIVNEQGEY